MKLRRARNWRKLLEIRKRNQIVEFFFFFFLQSTFEQIHAWIRNKPLTGPTAWSGTDSGSANAKSKWLRVNDSNYLLVFLSEPDHSAEMLHIRVTFFSHCQPKCKRVNDPQNNAQGFLWVLKKCLWIQQLFLRCVLRAVINEAVMNIHTSGGDIISHSHFKISAWLPEIYPPFRDPKD